MRAIAAEAAVAAGTVLLHFSDELSLLHAALHDDLEAAIRKSLRAPSRGALSAMATREAHPLFERFRVYVLDVIGQSGRLRSLPCRSAARAATLKSTQREAIKTYRYAATALTTCKSRPSGALGSTAVRRARSMRK